MNLQTRLYVQDLNSAVRGSEQRAGKSLGPARLTPGVTAEELVAYQQELDRQGLIRGLKSFGLFLVGALLAWLIVLEIVFTR